MTERRYSRSVSQLKSISRCPEAYRLERMVRPKLPKRPAAWTALGRAVHDSFCEWETSDRQIDVCEYFSTRYDEIILELKEEQPDLRYWMLPPTTKTAEASIKNYRQRGLEKDVPLYLARCLEGKWDIYKFPDGSKALELTFELDLDGVAVKGGIDRLQWWPSGEMIALEDLKTGNVDDEEDARQLGLYALAAREVYGLPVQWGRYWYTKLDRPSRWIDLSRYSRQYLTWTYSALDNTIDQRLFLPRPGKVCGLCSVRPWCREMGNLREDEVLFDDSDG